MIPGPRILVLHGLPASGKSTLAAALCAVEPALEIVSTDRICAEQALPSRTSDEIGLVYDAVLTHAETLARGGRGAIVDSTLWQRGFRDRLYARLADSAARWTLVNVVTPLAVCRARTDRRVASAASSTRAIEVERLFRLVVEGGSRIDASELARFDGVVDVDGAGAVPQLLGGRFDAALGALFAGAIAHLQGGAERLGA